ncbi:MAG: type IV pilus assembly protein PilM [Methylacidiphilales bacterium]|nr:type IV pilus assembly protein PilM [Candidatus Methylacidiphilales bacterium]MDW8349212.1 type IV pilus assembly protein PilM [Verrucomicrobiae bacterium]
MSKRILTLDIGSHAIKLAEFSIDKQNGIVLVHFGQQELRQRNSSSEDRSTEISQIIKQLLSEYKSQAREAFLTISSQSTLMRAVKLPPVEAAQIEKIIGFEAQQIIPFPLEEMAWDYQMVPSRSGDGEEALIVAVKKEILEPECRAIANAGLHVQFADAGPLALYNAYRFNYGYHPESVLILDLGAKATNLLFIEGSTFYSRSVPIAGNHITQQIANEFQETFQAAETLKKGKGYVNLGNDYADTGDPTSTRISHLIRNTMLKLYSELTRSINFYRTQQNGASPVRIYLTGGTAMIPYLDLFLAEKMKLSVEYFNPLKNISLHPSIDREAFRSKVFFLSELTGLALRAAGSAPIEITLSTPWIKQKIAERQRAPYLVASLIILFLLFTFSATAVWREITITQQLLETAQAENAQYQATASQLEPLEKNLDQLQHYLDQAKILGDQRQFWHQILNELHRCIPVGVWITELIPQFNGYGLNELVPPEKPAPPPSRPKPSAAPSGTTAPQADASPKPAPPTQINQLKIKGFFEKNLQPAVINTFVSALAESPLFDINPEKITEAIISTETPQDSDALGWSYELRIKLKTPLSIQP